MLETALHSKKIEEFLTIKGFKFHAGRTLDSDSVVANYYQVMYREPDLPFCLTNATPPQIYVREWQHKFPNMTEKPYRRYEVGIINETPHGWIDFKFYSLDEDQIINRFEGIKSGLLESWRICFP